MRFFYSFLTLLLITFSACDDCSKVDCQNNGVCNDGTCECPPGVSGDDCGVILCDGVTCQNGGSCVNGACDCPTGFVGPECESDLCEDIDCQNGGTQILTDTTCSCDCPENFVGDNCETDCRTRFAGVFTGTDNCTNGNSPVNVSIALSSTAGDRILLSGFYGGNFTAPVEATIGNCNEFVIPNQTPDNNGVSIIGTGTTNNEGATVSIIYTVTNGGVNDACTITLTKQ